MDIRIAQGFKYQGEDWWNWWVWIEGTVDELDQIDSVVYTLHPTFPNPVRTVNDRRSKFRLETSGWGGFRIYAQIIKRNGAKIKLTHDLVLAYDDGTPTTA